MSDGERQVSVSLESSIQSGSEAQLNGLLSRDFTSSCRAELVGLLSQPGPLTHNILGPLLVSTDEEILLLAVEALASATRSHHLVHDEKMSSMVRELSRGWPPLDLLCCVSGKSSSRDINLEVEKEDSCLSSFNRLVREQDVPVESRFGLLTKVRFARAFSSTGSRHAYLKIMILAMQMQWERKLMPRQLRKLVKSGNQQIPGSIRLLALETLTAYERTGVFSPADRERRVESFLTGRKEHDSSFVEAMLRNSSPVTIGGHHHHRNLPGFIVSSASADNVLTWLELENAGAAEQEVVERLLLSGELRTVLEAGAEDENKARRLRDCLLGLLHQAELLGARVFNRATSLLFSKPPPPVPGFRAARTHIQPLQAEVESALVEAMLSVAIPSGWRVDEEAAVAALFFSRLDAELEKKTIQLFLSDAGLDSFLLRHALKREPRFTSALLGVGGYDFIRRLPAGLLPGKKPEFPMNHVNEAIAGGFSRDLDDCSSPEKLATLVGHLEWVGNCGALLTLLQEKLVAVLEALAWPLADDACLSILKHLAESSEPLGVNIFLDSALRFHGAPRFFLELAGKWPSSESVLLAAWRRVGMDQKRQAAACLLDELGRESARAALTRLVSSRKDWEHVRGLRSRVLNMLRSSGSCRDLPLLLNHILEVLDWDPDTLFIPTRNDRFTRMQALSWYESSLLRAPGSTLATAELLKLGATLTRDYELAQKLLASWELPDLVDTLLEAAGDDPCARFHAMETVAHLLEDDSRVLYFSMVQRIRRFTICCNKLDDFLRGLSSEALRNPAIFVRASLATCDFTWRPGMVELKPELAVIPMLDVGPCFDRLVTHLLSRLDDPALEFLSALLQKLPVLIQAAVNAGALERVLVCSAVSDTAFSRFIDVFEMNYKSDNVTRALFNIFSSPEELGGGDRLVTACKRVLRCRDCIHTFPAVFKGIARSLRLLDLDHPELPAAAASVLGTMILRFLVGDNKHTYAPVPPRFDLPAMPDACVRAFRSRLEQSAARSMRKPAEGDLLCEPPEEEDDIFWTWKASDEEIDIIGRFLCMPSDGPPGLQRDLGEVLYFASSKISLDATPRIVVDMLVRTMNGTSATGVNVPPELVLRRVMRVLWKLSSTKYSYRFTLDEGTALKLIPLLVTVGMKVSRKLSIRLLELAAFQLQKSCGVERGCSIPLSPQHLQSVCSLAIASSDRLLNALVILVSLDPELSPAFSSCVTALSGGVISSALQKLERGDYSASGALARLARLVEEGVPGEHLAGALAPLQRFIRLPKRIGKSREHIIQAFFVAEAFRSAPSGFSVELLRNIAAAENHKRIVRLALPMLRRWPSLVSVDFSTRLGLLRDTIVKSPLQPHKLRVSRANILRDSYEGLAGTTPDFLRSSHSITVVFAGEPAFDYGGLRREWYQVLSRAMAEELFTEFGNPRSISPPLDISYLTFAGRMVAKAIVDDEHLDVHLSRSFCKHLLGQEVSYQDIDDPELLRNIKWLLENHVDESMGLTFSVDVRGSYDLVAGGSDIPVTDANKHEYVKLLAEYLLTESIRPEMDAFLAGFYEVMPRKFISMFFPAELEMIICGLPDINVADLKSVAECEHDDHIVEWFWEVVAGFDSQNKASLLKFITGSSKVPYGGVKEFVIGRSLGGEEHLPHSHTCANEIHVPRYKTKEQLRDKLVLAIQEERFEFG